MRALHPVFYLLALLFLSCEKPSNSTPLARGSVSVELNTRTYGGKYAPRNIGAVWVQTPDGIFIKTLGIWYVAGRQMLKNYFAVSSGVYDTVDAVTSASQRDTHDEKVAATWNLTNEQRAIVPQGTYEIWVEFLEDEWTDTTVAYPGKTAKAALAIDGSARTAHGSASDYIYNFTATCEPD